MAQYPPPQPGFAPNYGQQQQTIVTAMSLGETPVRMRCPNCQSDILTNVEEEFSLIQHIAFGVMCLTGICWICSCVPYCMSSLSNIRHKCPKCGTHLGTYKR